MAKNSPNLTKDIIFLVWSSASSKQNMQNINCTFRNISVKLLKTKDKETIFQAAGKSDTFRTGEQ